MKRLVENMKHAVRMILSYIAPKTLAGFYYRKACHKKLNWKNPQDLNEVINWLKFNGDTSMWPLFADKYRVREYVEKKGLGHTLVKLYGVWENAKDIDFNALPNAFVLKTNHGCATNILVKDKSALTPPLYGRY